MIVMTTTQPSQPTKTQQRQSACEDIDRRTLQIATEGLARAAQARREDLAGFFNRSIERLHRERTTRDG